MHGFPPPRTPKEKKQKPSPNIRHLYPPKKNRPSTRLKRGWSLHIPSSLTISYLQTHVAPEGSEPNSAWPVDSMKSWAEFLGRYTHTPKCTWQAGKSAFLIRGTSSTGCFFQPVMFVFGGVSSTFGDVKPYRVTWKLEVFWFGIQY